jgi:hypothetical protein
MASWLWWYLELNMVARYLCLVLILVTLKQFLDLMGV